MHAHDFSDLPDELFNFALSQLTWGGVLTCEAARQRLDIAPNEDDVRRQLLEHDPHAFWNLWLRFSIGVENLLKAVLLRHEIPILSKRPLLDKQPGRPHAPQTPAAAEVYRWVRSMDLRASTNAWLAAEFARLGIAHPWEINTGTLGSNRLRLAELVPLGKLSAREELQVRDALGVLTDMRRNVDAHVFQDPGGG